MGAPDVEVVRMVVEEPGLGFNASVSQQVFGQAWRGATV